MEIASCSGVGKASQTCVVELDEKVSFIIYKKAQQAVEQEDNILYSDDQKTLEYEDDFLTILKCI